MGRKLNDVLNKKSLANNQQEMADSSAKNTRQPRFIDMNHKIYHRHVS